MLDVLLGEAGQIERACDGEATARVEDCPACERHTREAREGGGLGGVCITALSATHDDYLAECARLRALGLY